MNIVGFLKQQEDFISMKGATDSDVKKAEKKLGLAFAEEYKEYVRELGACCSNGHELMGVVKHPQVSVVEATKKFREKHLDLPNDFYMVERIGVDGICLFQNAEGGIYEVDAMGNVNKVYDSLLALVKS